MTTLYIIAGIVAYLAVGLCLAVRDAMSDPKFYGAGENNDLLSIWFILWPIAVLMDAAGALAVYLGDKCRDRRERRS